MKLYTYQYWELHPMTKGEKDDLYSKIKENNKK